MLGGRASEQDGHGENLQPVGYRKLSSVKRLRGEAAFLQGRAWEPLVDATVAASARCWSLDLVPPLAAGAGGKRRCDPPSARGEHERCRDVSGRGLWPPAGSRAHRR